MTRKMLSLVMLLAFLVGLGSIEFTYGGDVNVRGYYRRDGTYVQPHVRSSPDSHRWNNYGPSRSDSERISPYSRDNDHDGMPNYRDRDDDNDGVSDDRDNSQYGR